MKKILIIPGNTFVSRNYFSSPMIENLKRISIKDNIKIIVAEIESNPIPEEIFNKLKKIFEDDYNIQFVKLIKNPESPIERIIWYLKNNFFHKALTYRFNEINNFITQKRYKEITKLKLIKMMKSICGIQIYGQNILVFLFQNLRLFLKYFIFYSHHFYFQKIKLLMKI